MIDYFVISFTNFHFMAVSPFQGISIVKWGVVDITSKVGSSNTFIFIGILSSIYFFIGHFIYCQ